ncbi:hypothetical protein CHS0354_025598 [Potamilus streckersoni]|uniref:Uncharacterized protein n=1 Tax=Potamilus streckersoni TaxID=2493646 RepID=A0AAE0S1A0_9BIVA|nr:hypothetical protein CHS0354_025598 [Potamilus streckersoni]
MDGKTFDLSVYFLVFSILGEYSCNGHMEFKMVHDEPINTTVNALFEKIKGMQILQEKNGTMPFSWTEQKGSYVSEVKLNFHGDFEYAALRRLFAVPDNNMFTSAWVTSCLLEAYSYGNCPKPSKEQIGLSVNAISEYHNRNPNNGETIMTFWPQVFNTSVKAWQSVPGNLNSLLNLSKYFPGKAMEEILKLLHLDEMEKALEELLRYSDEFLLAFHIPPDFDDTFVNLGVGALLGFNIADFNDEWNMWYSRNRNMSAVFDALKKYAYRPFSSDNRVNSIDPRTYFYMRYFLSDSKSIGGDLALVTTWVQDTEEVKSLFFKGVAMPFNINNVDITVCANVIFGITAGVLSNVIDKPDLYIDEDVKKIYMNTTSLIAYEIARNLSSRPDLTLTYYPSKFEFYWFTSRTYSLLNRKYGKGGFTKELEYFEFAWQTLGPVLKQYMTSDVILSFSLDTMGRAFVDDFLGDGDLDLKNVTHKRAEDRIFSTAMAVNSLIYTWTIFDGKDRHLVWDIDTPDRVKTMTARAVDWLNIHTLLGEYKPWNTFFSGSGKGIDSMPFPYPANRREYFNGTTFPDTKFPPIPTFILAMQGYVSDDEYTAMLMQPHFGMMTPLTFNGYNSELGSFFPFWSCDAYTYSAVLVALANYQNIRQ